MGRIADPYFIGRFSSDDDQYFQENRSHRRLDDAPLFTMAPFRHLLKHQHRFDELNFFKKILTPRRSESR